METKKGKKASVVADPKPNRAVAFRKELDQAPMSIDEEGTLGLAQIPYHALQRLSSVFVEGQSKYGRDNWKRRAGTCEGEGYDERRLCHAIRHLMLFAGGDKEEDHLAKVMWFCATQMERSRLAELRVEENLYGEDGEDGEDND